MDINEIKSLLTQNHQSFITEISNLSAIDFSTSPNKKWSAAQQLDHIIKSVNPVDTAFGLPSFVLKMKFGLANRPSKSYNELVTKYQNALKENKGYTLPKSFAPDPIPIQQKEKRLRKLLKLVQKLNGRLTRFSEKELDTYILPHPIMGKLTLREMLYFTIYHVEHHERQILKNLNNEN